MESSEQNKLTKWIRLVDTENISTAVRGEAVGDWVRRVKRLSKEIKERLMDTDNSMVTARGKGRQGLWWKRVKGG